jgi:hydrogenase 3 maturation protease
VSIVTDIRRLAGEGTCIVGVGNPIRGDDAVGPYMVDELRKGLGEGAADLVNAEDVLESYAFEIAGNGCANVIVIDAVRTGNPVGSVVFGALDDMAEALCGVSTHRLSLSLVGKIWKKQGKKTYLLGIEAGNVDFGNGLSEPVRKSADMLKDIIISSLTGIREGYLYEH